MLQGMVINFIQCRQMLTAYEAWATTGKAPRLPALVLPSDPAGNAVAEAELVDRSYRDLLGSGEIKALRTDLTSDSGCGDWIPARPRDLGGPTVADVVLSLKAS